MPTARARYIRDRLTPRGHRNWPDKPNCEKYVPGLRTPSRPTFTNPSGSAAVWVEVSPLRGFGASRRRPGSFKARRTVAVQLKHLVMPKYCSRAANGLSRFRTMVPSIFEASGGPFSDYVAFQFRRGGDDGEHRAAHGGGGFQSLLNVKG